MLLCAVVFHERTEWKLKYVGPPAPADVVKTILHLLYNLAAELLLTVIAWKAAEALLATNRQERPVESGYLRWLSDDCDNRQERSNHLKEQLGETAVPSHSYECFTWAPRFSTGLLIKLTPKGAVFPFLFYL